MLNMKDKPNKEIQSYADGLISTFKFLCERNPRYKKQYQYLIRASFVLGYEKQGWDYLKNTELMEQDEMI